MAIPSFGRHGIVEIFVVRRPPERIVDDVGSLQHRVLQVAAVVLHFVRNAVDDHAVFGRLVHPRAAQLHKFRGDAVFRAQLFSLAR